MTDPAVVEHEAKEMDSCTAWEDVRQLFGVVVGLRCRIESLEARIESLESENSTVFGDDVI